MKLIIRKWGNNAAVRLPTALLAQLGVKIGDVLDVDIYNHVAKIQASKPRYKLADLLAEMPNGMPMIEGWDSMHTAGREIACIQSCRNRR